MDESTPVEPAPDRTAWQAIKAFSPLTFIGLGLILLFLYCLSVDTYVVRWWLMIPLASLGCGLFWVQKRRSTGAEARVCLIGFGLMLILFLVRDIALSKELANLLDTVNQYKGQVNDFNSGLERFFTGGR